MGFVKANLVVHLKIAATGLTLLFVGCAASAPNDGICKRTCGSRPIAGGKIKVERVSPNDVEYTCDATSPEWRTLNAATGKYTYTPIDEFEATFLVYEDKSTGKEDEASNSLEANLAKRLPKAGVSFHPIIFGRTADQDNYDTATPSGEWCTDSCGYAVVKVRPICAYQDMSVNIAVAGALGEAADEEGGTSTAFSIKVSEPD
jgi:hypothetical protein